MRKLLTDDRFWMAAMVLAAVVVAVVIWVSK